MQALAALFPANDFTLLAFIVLLPLLGAVVNGLFGKRLGREAVTLMGLGVILVAFVLSVVSFCMLFSAQEGIDYPTEATFFLKVRDESIDRLAIRYGWVDVAEASETLAGLENELLP